MAESLFERLERLYQKQEADFDMAIQGLVALRDDARAMKSELEGLAGRIERVEKKLDAHLASHGR